MSLLWKDQALVQRLLLSWAARCKLSPVCQTHRGQRLSCVSQHQPVSWHDADPPQSLIGCSSTLPWSSKLPSLASRLQSESALSFQFLRRRQEAVDQPVSWQLVKCELYDRADCQWWLVVHQTSPLCTTEPCLECNHEAPHSSVTGTHC